MLLLDKIGIIIFGNWQVIEFVLINGVSVEVVVDVVQLLSLVDEILEGCLIVVLVKDEFGLCVCDEGVMLYVRFVLFIVEIWMFGVDFVEVSGICWICKGVVVVVMKWVCDYGGYFIEEVGVIVDGISFGGGIFLVVVEWIDNSSVWVIGVVYLKDIVKVGIWECFDEMC